MSLNLEEKKAVVAQVREQLNKAHILIVAEYCGIQVDNMTVLRKQSRGMGVSLHVLKNTLARRAVSDTPFSSLQEHFTGPLLYAFSGDPITAAKVLSQGAKDNDKIVIKAGAYNGKVVSASEINELASIPSREVLLARLLGVMQAPLVGLVRVLGALAARSEQEAQQ